MTTRNIRLSIIVLFLFTINVLFYYFFNQIAFIINCSNRTYPASSFLSRENIKAPLLTAEVLSFLFPGSTTVNLTEEKIITANPVSAADNMQVSTLNENTEISSAAPLSTIDNNKPLQPKVLVTPVIKTTTATITSTETKTVSTTPNTISSSVVTDLSDAATDEVDVKPAKNVMGHVNSADIKNLPITRSVSKDANVAGKVVTINGQSSLMVYPTNAEWHEMFVILNLNPSDKTPLKSIVTPDFEGVVYPSLQKGEITIHGTNYKITLVKLKGHNPNSSYPYFLSLTNSSTFFIFGDYSDKNKWYIYENNEVTQFSPTSDIHFL
ncbi:MAG: hypothetical protein JSS96_01045 [Bacteroidetes bacterium]|nr:hypothetical protein [Bacteroidota bacterium]